MMQSYDRLGLTELRDDADRVLRQELPEQPIYADGASARKRAWWQFW